MVRDLSLERKLHGGWALYQQFAGSHDEGGVRISDSSRELSEGTSIASVRVCPEQHLHKAKQEQEAEGGSGRFAEESRVNA